MVILMQQIPPPEEGIRHQQADTAAFIDGVDQGAGTLYIAESRLAWFNRAQQGFSLEYPAICLHAVSRDPNTFAHENLYVMVDYSIAPPTVQRPEGVAAGGDAGNDSDSSDITEIRFVPSDKTALDTMFDAMSHCQSLHPDPDDSEDSQDPGNYEDAEDDSGGEFYADEIAEGDLSEEGRANLERMEQMLSAQSHNGVSDLQPRQTSGSSSQVDNEPGEEEMEIGQFDDAAD